jgi:hypothetical protein
MGGVSVIEDIPFSLKAEVLFRISQAKKKGFVQTILFATSSTFKMCHSGLLHSVTDFVPGESFAGAR